MLAPGLWVGTGRLGWNSVEPEEHRLLRATIGQMACERDWTVPGFILRQLW